MNRKEHLYLTGYRATGKSAVGSALAKRTGRPVIDLDQVITAVAGKSIREIFAAGGEALFRRLESESLATVAQADPAVIALGGGAILAESNRQLIRRTGRCVWLKATPETIANRMKSDANTDENRPALTEMGQTTEIRQLLQQRESIYRQVADWEIDTDEATIDQLTDQIAIWLEQ